MGSIFHFLSNMPVCGTSLLTCSPSPACCMHCTENTLFFLFHWVFPERLKVDKALKLHRVADEQSFQSTPEVRLEPFTGTLRCLAQGIGTVVFSFVRSTSPPQELC